MPQIFGFGTTLLTERYLDRTSHDKLQKETKRASAETSAVKTDFTPIAIGKPLSVEIAYIYAGDLAAPGWFSRRPDLMISSAVKQLPIFDAAPRAINALVNKVESNFQYAHLPAVEKGTPLIYYSPALTDRGTVVTVEMTFDRFSEETFNQIGSMLSSAAGIPVFAPASTYLMAAGVLTKVGTSIAEAIFDGRPSFAETATINLNRPGLANTPPGYTILTNSDEIEKMVEKKELYADIEKGGLIYNKSGERYSGPAAYVILSFDGAERLDYSNFAPTIASAAILDRFLHTGEQRPTATKLLLSAMQAYNDIHFRLQIEDVKERLKGVDLESEEGKYLKVLAEAYSKNISDKELRPSI